MTNPKFFGMIYHDDSETSSSNYIAFSFGQTKEETEQNLSLIKTPKFREETKIFEFGKDVDISLHQFFLDETTYYYNQSFWCDDALDSILKLKFVEKKHLDFSFKG